jgi:hypothetical protein
MKTLKLGMVSLMALAVLCAVGLVGGRPASANMAAQLSKLAKFKANGDPILSGMNSQTIGSGNTVDVTSISTSLNIGKTCKTVEIEHIDGNIFDPNNTGLESLNGMDVAIVFLDTDSTVVGGFFLGNSPVNGSIYNDGYTALNPKSVYVAISDISPRPTSAELIVEGNVTNTGTSSQTANSTVTGIVRCLTF